MNRRCRTRICLVAGALALAAATQANAAGSFADLSLEQLSSIVVTSVGKRSQRLQDVAGSVFVIRGEDIRRAGATSLPEALRLAPNLQVARSDASQYAITARAGADLLANKMLVMVDGRGTQQGSDVKAGWIQPRRGCGPSPDRGGYRWRLTVRAARPAR